MSHRHWWPAAGLLLGGAATAAALPPVNLVALLWLTVPWLLFEIDRRPGWRGAFFAGWLFGLGYFAAGLYWISNALLVDAARFGWMIPFALVGIGAVLGVYIGGAAALSRFVRPGWPRLSLFAAAWGGAEWLRDHLLTGFPWNPIGSVWSASDALLQSVALIGSFGLGVVTILAAGAPVLFWQSRRQGLCASLLGLTLLAGLAGWGEARIPAASTPIQPGVMLRLVQANIAQTLKWRPEMRAENLDHHLALSRLPAAAPLTAIIWPETAAPAFLDQDQEARRAVAAAAPPGGLMLVGTVRGEFRGRELTQIWDSIEAFDRQGDILGRYDKAHLVPFGEYVPLPGWLQVKKLTAMEIETSAGPGPRTLDLPGLPPVGPQICYEAIFPAAIVDREHRPAWMLNATNDGWFGISSGPYQHFAAARMRAIEEGLPMVRAAYTGISGVIDPYGRVIANIGLGQEGIVDSPLPQPVSETLFARWGHRILAILLLITALPALIDKAARSQWLWSGAKKTPRVIDVAPSDMRNVSEIGSD
jgi:apolipoprotein N-acyltransferase